MINDKLLRDFESHKNKVAEAWLNRNAMQAIFLNVKGEKWKTLREEADKAYDDACEAARAYALSEAKIYALSFDSAETTDK